VEKRKKGAQILSKMNVVGGMIHARKKKL